MIWANWSWIRSVVRNFELFWAFWDPSGWVCRSKFGFGTKYFGTRMSKINASDCSCDHFEILCSATLEAFQKRPKVQSCKIIQSGFSWENQFLINQVFDNFRKMFFYVNIQTTFSLRVILIGVQAFASLKFSLGNHQQMSHFLHSLNKS